MYVGTVYAKTYRSTSITYTIDRTVVRAAVSGRLSMVGANWGCFTVGAWEQDGDNAPFICSSLSPSITPTNFHSTLKHTFSTDKVQSRHKIIHPW